MSWAPFRRTSTGFAWSSTVLILSPSSKIIPEYCDVLITRDDGTHVFFEDFCLGEDILQVA